GAAWCGLRIRTAGCWLSRLRISTTRRWLCWLRIGATGARLGRLCIGAGGACCASHRFRRNRDRQFAQHAAAADAATLDGRTITHETFAIRLLAGRQALASISDVGAGVYVAPYQAIPASFLKCCPGLATASAL